MVLPVTVPFLIPPQCHHWTTKIYSVLSWAVGNSFPNKVPLKKSWSLPEADKKIEQFTVIVDLESCTLLKQKMFYSKREFLSEASIHGSLSSWSIPKFLTQPCKQNTCIRPFVLIYLLTAFMSPLAASAWYKKGYSKTFDNNIMDTILESVHMDILSIREDESEKKLLTFEELWLSMHFRLWTNIFLGFSQFVHG